MISIDLQNPVCTCPHPHHQSGLAMQQQGRREIGILPGYPPGGDMDSTEDAEIVNAGTSTGREIRLEQYTWLG
jgi:hypothetical protein